MVFQFFTAEPIRLDWLHAADQGVFSLRMASGLSEHLASMPQPPIQGELGPRGRSRGEVTEVAVAAAAAVRELT